MPKPPLPDTLNAFLAKPNPAVIATLQPNGAPNSVATWYLWENGRVLVNMDESRARLDWMRRDPRVSLTVLDEGSWYRHLSLHGGVVSIEPDPDLTDIDRISRHYRGEPYANRERRSWSAWIEIDSWHGWANGKPILG
jgi:PPOX class probable F420-dependent enzyme